MSTLRFGGREVTQDRALVMAIVNRTRDSFYDRGATFGDREALAAVDRVVAEGADIVDVGGVRAGQEGEVVTPEQEVDRVVPFLEHARATHPDRPCRRELDPPRFCPTCGRRLRVKVHPAGWEASCRDHGPLPADAARG